MTINKTSYGVVLGMILPLLTSFGFFYFGVSAGTSWTDFFSWLVKINFASSLFAVSALSDLAFFMGFAYSNKMNIAKGIFLSTLFWAMVVVVFKFIIQD
ncbi:MAG: hypothetical protein MJZ15_06650 [Bacteroidales bacterium]|nr:hypothetical protein [Bacteroidales bacterium]